jgi:hypothetical protein
LVCFIIDVACLATQATGGGLAGAAYSSGASTQPGATTMIARVIAHLIAAVIFSFLLVFVMYRGARELKMKANRSLLNVALATVFGTLMMIMRNVYRSIELSEGWRGYLITHERYVLVLDALPMALCMGFLWCLIPGRSLRRRLAWVGRGWAVKSLLWETGGLLVGRKVKRGSLSRFCIFDC